MIEVCRDCASDVTDADSDGRLFAADMSNASLVRSMKRGEGCSVTMKLVFRLGEDKFVFMGGTMLFEGS